VGVVDRACAKPEDALNDAGEAVGRVARGDESAPSEKK
jgi:hypothetical protein